jgi:citrate synthase
MRKAVGDDVTHDQIRKYIWETLKSGQVIPGYGFIYLGSSRKVTKIVVNFRYGHGVLRHPDPRFIALQQFCDTRPVLSKSPFIQLVQKVRRIHD